ncbi:MAG: carboxypeptidase regulatory-like domain-containing protein [Acidobacteriota bacterium]|nr:carboxypeptidase regulatory-like domain-containing protein [Acidobacteriota bacterium]
MRALLLVVLPCIVCAQDFRASLNGRITDAQGAAAAGALIALRDVEKNETQHQTADREGNYIYPLVAPGSYELKVSHPGFKTATRSGMTLNVNQAATVDVTLDIGSVNDQVVVTADVPLLDLASGDRGGLIDGKTIAEMPLNGRNPFMLASLVAGVDYNGSLAYQRPFDNGAIAQFGIGGSSQAAEFLIDGVPNNAQAGGNNIAYVPPVDSVQEFKIQTNAYDAQYGKTAGGVMNAVLKSGSNGLHGSVYEYMRRNWLDANSFQNNARGAAKDGHSLDQYGALVSGPVIVPKVYNGRNRTFYMVNAERYVEDSPQPLVLSVPSLEMRNGDFSKLKDKAGRQYVIYDPASGFTNSSGAFDRLPFPGNVIPPARINPIAQKILSYFPAPNVTTAGEDYAQKNLFLSGGVNPARDTFYNLAAKIDQNLSERHRFFVRYTRNDRTEIRPTNGVPVDKPGVDGQAPLKRTNDSAAIDWISTLTPNVILNVRTSFARYVEAAWGTPNNGFDLTKLGFPRSLAEQLPGDSNFGRYTFSGYQSLGRYPSSNISNTFTFHPNLTWAKGSRTLKGGLDMRWLQYSIQSTGDVFTLGASAAFTQEIYNTAQALKGNSIASWLLGTPSSGAVIYNALPIYMFPYFAPWAQFDWKVSRRLTINLGLRQDNNLPPTERFNRIDRGFDGSAPSAVDGLVDRSRYPLPALTGSLAFAGANGASRRPTDSYYNTWQPRFGFAYALTRSTVVRGGWGRFYMNANNDYLQTTGFSNTTPLVYSPDESRLPLPDRINDPFPDGVLVPTGSRAGSLTYAGRAFNVVNTRFRLPHVNSFSFGLQRALTGRSVLDVSYSASRGVDLQDSRTLNDIPAALRDGCNYFAGGNPSSCDKTFPNPFANIAAFTGTSSFSSTTLSRATLSAPYPQFGQITELMRNDGRNWYDSLQTSYSIRNKWTTFRANYTYSKNIERSGFLDPQNLVMQKGPASYDIPHHFSLSAVTQLPGGHSGPRALRKLTGGWQQALIIQQQSGRPWGLPTNIIYVKDATHAIDWKAPVVQGVAGCVSQWNNNGSVTLIQSSIDSGCTSPNWIISPRYSPRYEPNRESNIRLQGFHLIDVSLDKTTSIGEKYKFQFRAEMFNSFNSFFLTNQGFDATAANSTFGSIIKAGVSAPNSNYPRQAQLGFKLLW